MTKIKYIFFDLDGTLINSVGDLTVAGNIMRNHFNLPPVDENILANIIGKGYPTTVRKLLALNFTDKEYIESIADKSVEIIATAYKSLNSKNTVIYNGVIDTLEYLKNKNIKMAVVTNKDEKSAILALEYLGLSKYFNVIVGGNTTSKYKPSAKPLLFAINKIDANIEQSLMVGDSINDFLCAKEANVKAIMVSYGYNHGLDLSTLGAFACINDFSELKNYID